MTKNLEFEAPGPGSWITEPIHCGRAISIFAEDDLSKAICDGMSRGFEQYGGTVEAVDFKPVNHFFYMSVRPVGAPPNAEGLPPKWVFRLIQLVHPKIRRWRKRANKAFQDKSWRPHIEWWDNEEKPWAVARAEELRRIDLKALGDENLISHLADCKKFLVRTMTTHHVLNMCFWLPLGDFLAHAREWTDISLSELLGLFEGYSEASRGAGEQLRALGAALTDDPEMTALVGSETPPDEIMALIRARTGPVADAVAAYLEHDGYRIVTGYDVADNMISESPEMMVRVIRSTIETGTERQTGRAGDLLTDSIRSKIPEQHVKQFDELLAEARSTYRIREERGAMGDALSTGLTRRAILEAGRRLQELGKVYAAEEVVDATMEEITALLTGSASPTADEIRARVEFRLNQDLATVPQHLGLKPVAPPPADWYPKSGRRAFNAFLVVFNLMFKNSEEVSSESVIRGEPVFPGIYEGTARLVEDMFDMEKIEDGDILVTRATAPSYNIIFPMLGAVVTNHGGLLCHAAITAREFGIPAVVGCGNATVNITDGMRISIDGEAGEVRILN